MMEFAQPARIGSQMAMDVASAAATGIALNRLWLSVDVRAWIVASLRRWLIVVSWLLLASVSVEFLALAAVMSDATTFGALRAALPDVASTEAGSALVRTACAALPLVALALVPTVLRSSRSTIAVLALTCVVLVLRTPLGHPSSDGPCSLREIIQFVHLASIAVWGGGVMVAGLVVMPGLGSRDAEQARKFGGLLSRTVTIALPCVVLSGTYSSWRGLGGSLAPLPHTQWGQLLLSKVLAVCIALALGARVRFLLGRARGAQPSTMATGNLRPWLRLEAFVMFAILILSAWLANAPPAAMDASAKDAMSRRFATKPTLSNPTIDPKGTTP